ncbi:MAG: alanine racemase [Spirochaetaceae bacterium]|nr:alanine racemase [Treponema sp.]MBP3449960.1 alanine racemase [Spirochaetaceae bacterium]
MRATRAIIHLDNLRFNINEIKKLIPQGTKICFPVKADGYGHGAVDLAKVALEQGIYCLAVATVDEGIFLRNAGLECPIMLFSLPCLEELDLLVKNDLTPFVFEEYFVEELNKVAKKNNKIINVHIKIDTGMARIGCDYTEVLPLAQKIKSLSNLNLQGLGTHLCVSDSIKKDDVKFTLSQISKIDKSVKILNENDIYLEIVHCAASGGVLMYPNAIFDMIRPGILFYGYFPDEIVKKYLNKNKKDVPLLKPVMELETRIETIKKISKGQSVSYGRTWKAKKDTYLATIPIGYADGLLRQFSSKLKVKINDKMYPIVGRICMDQCMIDLGESTDVKIWDKVTIFGPVNSDELGNTAQTLANLAKTIPYEITCSVDKRVPRDYV